MKGKRYMKLPPSESVIDRIVKEISGSRAGYIIVALRIDFAVLGASDNVFQKHMIDIIDRKPMARVSATDGCMVVCLSNPIATQQSHRTCSGTTLGNATIGMRVSLARRERRNDNR